MDFTVFSIDLQNSIGIFAEFRKKLYLFLFLHIEISTSSSNETNYDPDDISAVNVHHGIISKRRKPSL